MYFLLIFRKSLSMRQLTPDNGQVTQTSTNQLSNAKSASVQRAAKSVRSGSQRRPGFHKKPTQLQPTPARHEHRVPEHRGVRATITWTLLGTLFPGVGLLRAHKWISGTLLVLITLSLPTILGIAYFQKSALPLLTYAATNTSALTWLYGIVVIVGIALATICVATYMSLRRGAWRIGQNVVGLIAVTAMVAGVIYPTHVISQTVLSHRSMMYAVFQGPQQAQPVQGLQPMAPDPWAGVDRVNILLVGSDAGAGRKGTRADTLIVASVEPQSGNTVLLSVPRNLAYPKFPRQSAPAKAWPSGFAPEQDPHINAVWTWAEKRSDLFPNDSLPGLTATKLAVEGSLGIEIDHYVVVDMQGFADVVDAIGGLNMYVSTPIAVAKSDDPRPTQWISAGQQTLNGHDALWFGRSRWGTDDYSRMRRQRCLIGALSEQASPSKLALVLPKLLRTATENIMTSIPADELGAYVILAERAKQGKLTSLAFTNDVIRTSRPNYTKIQTLTAAALSPAPAIDAATDSVTTSPSPESTAKPTSPKNPVQEPTVLDEVCSY